MIYRKLKRTFSHNDANYIPRLKEVFPELKKIDSEELRDRFIEMKMDFYYEKNTHVNFWTRLTLPFAMILFLIMFFGLPFCFLIHGEWGYPMGEKNRILNWFKSLKIL